MRKSILFILVFILSVEIKSATMVSTAAGGNWTVAATWVGGVVPGAADNASIATTGAGVVTLNSNTTCVTLNVNAGSRLTINPGFLLSFTDGTFNGTINGGGNMTTAAGFLATITNNSVMTIGTLNVGNGALITTLNNSATGSITTSGMLTIATVSFLNNNGGIINATGITLGGILAGCNNSGTITSTVLNLNQAIFLFFNVGSTFTNLNNGVFNITGIGTPVFVAANSTFDCNDVSNLVNYSGGAGTQVMNNTTYHNLTVSNAGTKNLGGTQTVNNDLTISGVILGSNTFNLTVGGDWTNNGTFTQGAMGVTFTSAAQTQTITGTTSTTFNNLTLNNTVASNTRIVLGINTTVTNTLTMTAGITNLNGFRLMLGTTAAANGTLVCTPSNTNFLFNGTFARWYRTTAIALGNVNGMFPMGVTTNSVYFAALYITCPGAAPTTGGSVTVSYSDPNTVSTVSFADAASTVVLRHDEMWRVGTGLLAGGTYTLRADRAFAAGQVTNIQHLRLTQLGSVVGASVASAGSVTSPQVVRGGLTMAQLSNDFYIGSINLASPLPIELLAFDASLNKENEVDLTWATAAEINNDYFTVQRSMDGINFKDIEKIQGAGNSHQQHNYSTIDKEPHDGISYYRLKQTDFDGKESFSDIKDVKNSFSTLGTINVFPNPSSNALTVSFSKPIDPSATFKVMDINGKLISNISVKLNEDRNKAVIDITAMSKGVYFVSVTTGSDVMNKHFVKVD